MPVIQAIYTPHVPQCFHNNRGGYITIIRYLIYGPQTSNKDKFSDYDQSSQNLTLLLVQTFWKPQISSNVGENNPSLFPGTSDGEGWAWQSARWGGGGGGEPCDELASHPMGVTIFLFASSYRTEKASFYFLYRWEMLTVLLLRLDSILLIDYKHLKCLWGNWWNVWLFWCDWFSRIAKFLSGKSAKLSTQIFFVKF